MQVLHTTTGLGNEKFTNRVNGYQVLLRKGRYLDRWFLTGIGMAHFSDHATRREAIEEVERLLS